MANIDRASANDVVHLASDRSPAPNNFGIVLVLDGPPPGVPELCAALDQRVRGVPRLRRRLTDVPLGCGRPIWVDDPSFDIARHVVGIRCPAPGDEQALLAVASDLVVRRLPRDRPLWHATLVRDLAQGRSALVIVLHHAMADGIAGLAVLASLVDGAPVPREQSFPQPAPTRRELLYDAMRGRIRALRHGGAALRMVSQMWRLASRPKVRVGRSSLNGATGTRRRLAVVRADLDKVRALAHVHGGTVNDVMLSAITGAVDELLASRGEHLPHLAVSIPAAARPATRADVLGNDVGLVVAVLPTLPEPVARLDAVVAAAREAKDPALTVSPAVMTVMSRLLLATGVAQYVIDRQRMVHTFVTNVRGPAQQLHVLGRTVAAAIPVSVAAGNVAVAFGVLSYAGTITVTAVADADLCPDLAVLGTALQEQLDALVGADAAALAQ